MPVLLLVFWILLNGRVTAEILLFGLIVSALVYGFMLRFLKWSPRRDLRLIRTLPIFLVYLLNLLWEMLKAACTVSLLALKPGGKPEPKLVSFHSGLDNDNLNLILAQSITLTPGTITVKTEGDRFFVHCLRGEYADGLENSSFIRLLRRFPK